MGAAIAALFKTVLSMNKDHRNMLREHGEMKHKIGKLEGQKEGIERLTADILELIHKILGRHESNKDPEVSKFKNDTDIEKLKRDLDL